MKKKKIAFIIGITGQDGSYLTALLLKKSYKVIGYTRSLNKNNLLNLKRIGVLKRVQLIKYSENQPFSILKSIKKNIPNEIYFLAGQSSVKKSFNEPINTYYSNINILFSILEYCRQNNNHIKIYNSSSTDCFGNSKKIFQNEKDTFKPESPYGNSKAFGFWLTKFYREKYNLNSKSGILSNHESPLRNKNFVLKKIINFVKNKKKNQPLYLGDTSVYRDWGWAPEFVEAIYKINNSKSKKDYVVGTGKIVSLNYIVKKIFKLTFVNKKFLKTRIAKSLRPQEIRKMGADASQIKKDLHWQAKIKINQIINKLLNNELY